MARSFIASVVLLLIFSSKLVNSTVLDCSYACQTPLARVQFNGSSPDDSYYVAECTNYLRVRSIFVCMKSYCSNKEIVAGLKDFKNLCEVYGFVELLPWSIADNITPQDAQSWTHIGIEDLSGTTQYNNSVYVSEELFAVSLRTTATWDQSEVTRANYGYAMYGFFGGVFLISMVARLVNYTTRRRHVDRDTTLNSKASGWQKLSLMIKRYITTPALFSHRVAEPVGWCTVPQRLQFFTILLFVVLNVVLCCVSYDVFEGNLYWPDTETQIWRYLSDRTGVIAISNMPLMFAFAMRNNVLIWLTGWDFSTFNMFHRWVSRVATIEAVIHSVGYTVEAFLDGGKAEFVEQWTERYWWTGVIATIVMSITCGISILPFRKLFYEVFLIVHILLAVVFLVGMWYHVEIFNGQYNPFIWPCVAVWAFDRLLRIARILCLNFSSLTATANYNAQGNIIRITVPVRKVVKAEPGTHYYLYGLHGWKPWESHPFSLSTWTLSEGNKQNLTFIVRPHGSFTARLRDRLVAAQSRSETSDFVEQTTTFRLMIEGPYGHSHNLSNYNSILMVIGGSGITVALSHLQALHEAMQNKSLPIHQVHLVWSVRNESFFNEVHKHELATWLTSLPPSTKVQFKIDVHVTRSVIEEGSVNVLTHDSNISSPVEALKSCEAGVTPVSPEIVPEFEIIKSSDNNVSEKPISSSRSSTSGACVSRVRVFNHRPKIHELVVDAASTWCVRGQRLAVLCCGPAGMLDDTRTAVVAAYDNGHEKVNLYSESFGW